MQFLYQNISELKRKKELFSKIFSSFSGNVADLGCGSGIDSYSLAKNGFLVDAFDPSIKMIQLAENKYSEFLKKIKFHNIPSSLAK